MDSKKSEELKYLQKIKNDLGINLEIESANGFLVIKGNENIILIKDKHKSQVLKGEDKEYKQYFSEEIDNLEEIKLSASTNKNKNLFPLTISAMRYSMAAIVADLAKSKLDMLSAVEFEETLKKIKEKFQTKNISFHEFFLEDSVNDLLYENNDFTCESTQLFEKKYLIPASEFSEKLNDLLAEQNNFNYSNSNNTPISPLNRLIEKLTTRDKKINLLNFYHLMNQTYKQFNYTNLILLGEFAERCKQEFNNSEKDQIKNLNKIREKIFDNLNYYELPIKTLPITSCKLGDNHILLLNIHGDLFAFGDGSKGATGNGIRNFHIIPKKLNFFSREKKLSINKEIKIEKIACGSRHCLALTTNKTVYSWGFGKNGRLGHGDDKDVFEPKIIEFFDNTRIEKIEAADNYSAVVSCVNSLFTWGCGEFNRLGHEGNSDEKTPKKVSDFSSDIVDVKCGYYSMIVLKGNELYSVGAKTLFSTKNALANNNTDEGKSDVPYFKVHMQDKKISKIIYNFVEKQKRILIGFSSGFSFISLVTQDTDAKESEALNHNASYTNNNEKNRMKLFIWGSVPIDNLYANKSSTFMLINDDYRAKREVSDELSPGGDNSNKYIDQQNKNNKNITNTTQKHSISKYFLEFQKNKTFKNGASLNESAGLKKIKSVHCSENNTVILASDGSLYAFGSAEFKIAKTSVEEYTIPIQPKLKIFSVGLGREHIIVVTSNYECYGWGRNTEGQLGLGEGSATVRDEPCLIEKLKNFGCLKAFAKENFSVVYNNNKRIHAFGDLGFLENDSSSAKKFAPKLYADWGEIEYFACGASHFVFVSQDINGNFDLKAIGNGFHGKLGYNADRDDNKNEPVSVSIDKDFVGSLAFNGTQWLKIVCSRRQTVLLRTFKDSKDKDKGGAAQLPKKSDLFVWGLCHEKLFTPDQKARLESSRKAEGNQKQTYFFNVNVPYEVTKANFQNIVDVEITDTIFYYINSENVLDFIGDLNKNYEYAMNENKIKKENFSNKNFKEIYVGRDHVMALDTQGKLYSWGNNNFKKLGIKHSISNISFLFDDEKKDLYKQKNLFYSKPQELKEFNKLFESQPRINTPSTVFAKQTPITEEKAEENDKSGKEVDEKESGEAAATYLTAASPNLNLINSEKKNSTKTQQESKKEEINLNAGLVAQTQTIIRNEFDELEENLLNKEVQMKEKMKLILAKCQFLKANETEAKALKRILFNNFTFKMADPPLNIAIKTRMKNEKYPEEYQKYKKNYKAFLSTLFNHPCYLKNIYEHIIINDKSSEELFYEIIKDLYCNMYQHEFKQLCFINLLKNLFDVYLTKKAFDKKKNGEKELTDYNITFTMKYLDIKIDFNLIFKMIGFFFRQNIKCIKNQELFAASVIASIFKRYGSFVTRQDYNSIFDFTKNGTKQNLYDYYSSIISAFFESMTKCADIDTVFNNANVSTNKNFFELPENILILISELADIVKKHFEQDDISNIYQWIYKNISIIMFKRFFKIMNNPKKLLAIKSSIVVEKKNFDKFLKGSFASIAWALKFSLLNVIFPEKFNSVIDDVSKRLKSKITDKISEYTAKYREIIKYPDDAISLTKKFDLNSLEEFFNYSLSDNNHYINFSLNHLKFLQKKITENIDKIRILSKDFDLMDIIFFNKNPEYYIGEEKGVAQLPNAESYIVQVNLKSRVLSNEIQNALMRCKKCKTICAKEFILANDENFFLEFDYLENTSKEGRLKKVLRTCDKINNKDNNKDNNNDILEFLKEQRAVPGKSNEFKDNLYYLFNLIAVDKKKDLYIEESDILNSEKLMDIMLGEKSIGKEIEELSKNLSDKYQKMKIQFDYYCNIEAKLEKIELKLSNNKQPSRKMIFSRTKDSLERGYSNKEILENGHILFSNCKLIELKKVNLKNDNSKGLSDKLSADKLNKILPYKEFNLKALKDDKIVLAVLQKDLKNISFNE